MHDRKNRKVQLSIIILLAIGLLIATFVWHLWTGTFRGKSTPQFTLICERYGDDYLVTITPLKFFSFPAGGFRYYLEYPNGTPLENNYCNEVYNLDPTFQDEIGNPITNVSFYDLDEDGGLSVNDTFLIRGENNTEIYNNKGEDVPGIGKDGLVFKLIFLPSGQLSGSLTLEDNAPVRVTFVKHHPLNKWNIVQHPLLPNLTISPIKHCLSAYPPMYGQNTSIQVILNNTDNISISNLSITFYESDTRIKQLENISVEKWNKTKVVFSHSFECDGTCNITVRVNSSGMVALEAYCEVIIIPPQPCISPSFDIDMTHIVGVVLIVALLATFKNRRGRK